MFGDPGSMHILWQSNVLEDFVFKWGSDDNYLLGSLPVTGNPENHLYQVELMGLQPGMHYYYLVSTAGAETRGDFFSPPSEGAGLVFWAFGDTRSGPEIHNQIARDILAEVQQNPAAQTFVLSAGDLMDTNSEASLQESEFPIDESDMPMLQAHIPVVNTLGNHDSLSLFNEYFPYPYNNTNDWSFDYGPVHILVVDQYIPLTSGSKRLEQLRQDLATSNKSWKIILLHEPGWSAGPHDNNMTVQELIQPLAVETGVQLVIGGHNHYYARAEVDGVVHLTTGGGGAPLYTPGSGWPRVLTAVKAYHYLKFEISGTSMWVQSLSPSGEILDDFTISLEEQK